MSGSTSDKDIKPDILSKTLIFNGLKAERQGFEPRVPRGTTVFKTAAIDHSATSPKKLFGKHFLSKVLQRYGLFWI